MRRIALTFLALAACAEPTAPATTHGSETVATFAVQPSGKLLGLSAWPVSTWGEAPISTTIATDAAKYLDNRLARARSQNFPVFVGFNRAAMTVSGANQGVWSLAQSKRSVDIYAAGVLAPDSVRKYAPWIVAWYLMDEPFCAKCWGGTPAKYGDVLEFARYFRERIDPDHLVPLAIRVSPSKLARYGDWDGAIDVAWTVWNTKRGTPQGLMDKEWAVAQRHGWQMVGGLNAEDCHGVGTKPCTATELKQYLEPILRHPGVCASPNWKYASDTWEQSAIRSAWDYLGVVARSLPTRRCV